MASHDEWIMSAPEATDPTCDYCGDESEIRVSCEGYGKIPPSLVCNDCFTSLDDGPCFDDLQLVQEYFQDREDERGDYLYEQAKDRKNE